MSDKFNHLHLLIPLNPQRIDFQNETKICIENSAASIVLINCILDRNPPSIRCHIYL